MSSYAALIIALFLLGSFCTALLGYIVGSYGLGEVWPWAYRVLYGDKPPPELTMIERPTGSGRAAPMQLMVDWTLIHSIVDASGMKLVPKERVH